MIFDHVSVINNTAPGHTVRKLEKVEKIDTASSSFSRSLDLSQGPQFGLNFLTVARGFAFFFSRGEAYLFSKGVS